MKFGGKTMLIIVVFVCVLAIFAPSLTYAAVPYNTFTQGPEYNSVPTQTAYLPQGRILPADGFSSPEDMTYDSASNTIFVADTGNKRILELTIDGQTIKEYGKGILNSPVGVAVNSQHVFVADKAEKAIYILDRASGAQLNKLGKPNNPLVGKNTPFVPVKIAVDDRENLYVVCEGSVNGIMQLNLNGEFIGNVGANMAAATLGSVLKEIFYSEQQRTTLLNIPRSPTNLAINSYGLLYTVTKGAYEGAIKKLNSQGRTIMTPRMNMPNTVALTVDGDDNLYCVDSLGQVTIYDAEGNILFLFGSTSSVERLGVLSNPVAVALAGESLMVLDKNYGMIISYTRTEFAQTVFEAVSYYKDGLYLEGESRWESILRDNSSFTLSYRALARANMKKQNYSLALKQFKLAEDKDGYSEAYWEIRNQWLRANLGWVILVAAVIVAAIVTLKLLDKRNKRVLQPFRNFDAKLNGVTLIKQLMHVRRYLKAPTDAVYETKYHSSAGVLSATILYVWFVVLQILSVVCKGYLFSSATVYNTQAAQVILYSTLPLLALVLCNYFVGAVTDGEGKLRHCYVVFIYALAPYLVMALPIFIVSNFITYNEQILLQFAEIVMYGWTGINLFRCIGELHDFNFGHTLRNILLTLFAFAMAILFFIVLRMLAAQLFGYFAELFTEIFNA